MKDILPSEALSDAVTPSGRPMRLGIQPPQASNAPIDLLDAQHAVNTIAGRKSARSRLPLLGGSPPTPPPRAMSLS
jgi:hypothetical protein